jgi:hydroxypyruvate isomerase
MYRLALNAETLFRDRPFDERVKEISERGFLVDFWSPEHPNLVRLAERGVEFNSFNAHLGGSLVDAEFVDEYVAGVRYAIDVAAAIGCRHLNIHTTGVDATGHLLHTDTVVTGASWITAYRTLMELAELAEQADVTFQLENLNRRVDHPGAPLAGAADVLMLVRAVDSPRVRVLLDLYHVQVDEGGLLDTIRATQPWLGHVQVADVPGRHEPGTGEINYPMIAAELQRMKYDGVIGLEAFPAIDDQTAIDRFCAAFA